MLKKRNSLRKMRTQLDKEIKALNLTIAQEHARNEKENEYKLKCSQYWLKMDEK